MARGVRRIEFLYGAHAYVQSLLPKEQDWIATDITLLCDSSAFVRTKQLRGPVRELIVGNHRITYFKINDTLFFVRGFRKKTRKTPPNEIEYAEHVYSLLSNHDL